MDNSSSLALRSLDDVERLAKIACTSGLVAHRRPEAAAVVLLTGRELGLAPMASLRGIYEVSGRPVLAADMMVAVVRRSGHCESWRVVESTPHTCTITTLRRGESEPESVTWTAEDAKRAGCGGQTWQRFPRQMLAHRAAAELARRVYPDVLLGLYTPDELGGVDEVEDNAPVVVAPPVARIDAATLNALGVEQRAAVRERVADVMASVSGDNPTLGEFNRAVNEDAEPTAYEIASSRLAQSRDLAELKAAWTHVRKVMWPTLGPAEQGALEQQKESLKVTLGQQPPDSDPPKPRRTRRPTAPVDATSAPQEAASTPDAGPAAWAPVTLSDGRVVRSAEDARALLRTYPEPRLHASAKAHGGEWAQLCAEELLARAAMARRAA